MKEDKEKQIQRMKEDKEKQIQRMKEQFFSFPTVALEKVCIYYFESIQEN
jgi:hypothetical protein